MNDESGFLKAIRANPDDVTTRLVYADWLEEHADPRAEYLRLHAESKRVAERLDVLRKQLDPAWLRTVGPGDFHFNNIYWMYCQFVLSSGELIHLHRLDQSMTYEGMPLGYPDREINDQIIADALQVAERRLQTRPHLIEPPRRDYRHQPGDSRVAPTDRKIVEWLPMIECIGTFTGSTARRGALVLTVVWYQDEFAPPLRAPALSQLRALDFEALAHQDAY